MDAGRVRVAQVRVEGPSPFVALVTPIVGRSAVDGMRHGSEPVARNASDR